MAVALRLFGNGQQARHRGAIDIGIQQPDFQAQPGQRQRQVHRHRGFADSALAAGHRDDVFHARNAGLGRWRLALYLRARLMMMIMTLLRRCLGLVLVGGQDSGDRFDVLHPQHHGFADLAQRLGLLPLPGRHFQDKADMAVLDHQALDHVLLNHGAAADRINHLVQRLQDVIAQCHGRGYSPRLG